MSTKSNFELEPEVLSQTDYPPSLAISETAKVDEAVRHLNERTVRSGVRLAKEVGEYILYTFFNGDYESFANPRRGKSTSFRALVEREDLLLGRSTPLSRSATS